jgi:hypothetical protein
LGTSDHCGVRLGLATIGAASVNNWHIVGTLLERQQGPLKAKLNPVSQRIVLIILLRLCLKPDQKQST